MRKTFVILAVSALIQTAGPVAADDAASRQMSKAETDSLKAFADDHKDCKEWGDGCSVCQRKDDGTFGCSLPGIACEPKALACLPLPEPQKAPAARPADRQPEQTKPDATTPAEPTPDESKPK